MEGFPFIMLRGKNPKPDCSVSLCFRRLWQNVTASLREKDIEKATEHKRLLEERQRTEERHRAETETPWRTRHFDKDVSSLSQLMGTLRTSYYLFSSSVSSFLKGSPLRIILHSP